MVNDVDNMNPTEPSVLPFPAASKIFLVVSRRSVLVSQSTATTIRCFLLLRTGNLPELFCSDFSVNPAFRASFEMPFDHAKTAFSNLLLLSEAFPSSELSFPLVPLFSPSKENLKFKDISCMSLKESPGESDSEFSAPSSFLCHCGCLGLQLAILDR